MKLLALESANEQCSVALIDATQTLFFQLDPRTKAQTQTILPMIDQAFAETGLDAAALTAIAFSRGPGSFSGVRINAAVCQALAWAHDTPVIAVSTLQALAQAAYRHLAVTEVTAVLDARMNEVYIASFKLEQGIMQAVDEECLLGYEAAASYKKYTAVGSGAHLIQAESSAEPFLHADALDIAAIAQVMAEQQLWVDAEHALPVYLRENAWKKISEQGKASK